MNENQIMQVIIYSQGRKQLVQNNQSKQHLETVSVFNKKCAAMYWNELLTWGLVVCHFYVCFDCKHKLHEDKGKESEDRSKHSSQ